MIAVVDYGAGNLRSVANALAAVGAPYAIMDHGADLHRFAGVILPGVGHFGSMMQALQDRELVGALEHAREEGKPILGICLGMQAFFESSEEAPGVPGLGWVPGTVERLTSGRVPHIGWNEVQFTDRESGWFAFANSYAVRESEAAWGRTQDGDSWVSAVRQGSLTGVQFHPEKSGAIGLKFLKGWCADAG